MRTREWKVNLGVIEGGRLPGDRGVALLAGRGKSAGHVIRVRRSLEVFQVARDTSRGRQVVVVIHMAVHAGSGRDRVPARQRKRGLGVVERCRLPRRSRVAEVATLREASSHVIRIRRSLEIL